MNLQARKI